LLRNVVAGTSARNPETVDWPTVMGRLYMAAVRLVGSSDRVIDCGASSAKDLVSEVIEQFYASPNGCGWDGTEAGLTRLLCHMVEMRFIDHVRRDGKIAIDSETPLATAICRDLGPDEQAAADQLRDKLFKAVRGHPKETELRNFIQAATMLTDGSMVDKQMAELLDATVGEVRNWRKMLLRITSIRELGIIMGGRNT
jgi:DNA-directed RNA polymerase specialized sigma24 family protein